MLEIQRGIKEEEIAFAVLLLRGCWKERGMIYTSSGRAVSQARSKSSLKEQWFLVKEEGKVIGIISVILWEGNVAEIRDRIIKKKRSRKGMSEKSFSMRKSGARSTAREKYTP